MAIAETYADRLQSRERRLIAVRRLAYENRIRFIRSEPNAPCWIADPHAVEAQQLSDCEMFRWAGFIGSTLSA